MPEGYPVPFEDEGTIHEQLLGRGDARRTTKTFIEDGPLAMYLGFVRGFPQDIINTGRRMYAEEKRILQAEEECKRIWDIDLNPIFQVTDAKEILEKFPEVRELIELHQQILEHKGSQSGFLVNSYVAKDKQENADKKDEKKSSSGESKKSRWN